MQCGPGGSEFPHTDGALKSDCDSDRLQHVPDRLRLISEVAGHAGLLS